MISNTARSLLARLSRYRIPRLVEQFGNGLNNEELEYQLKLLVQDTATATEETIAEKSAGLDDSAQPGDDE